MTDTPKDAPELADVIERLEAGVHQCGLHEDGDTELYRIDDANDAMFDAVVALRALRTELEQVKAERDSLNHAVAREMRYAEEAREQAKWAMRRAEEAEADQRADIAEIKALGTRATALQEALATARAEADAKVAAVLDDQRTLRAAAYLIGYQHGEGGVPRNLTVDVAAAEALAAHDIRVRNEQRRADAALVYDRHRGTCTENVAHMLAQSILATIEPEDQP